MADEQTPTEPSIVDGGDPTEQEAILAAQVDTIGENPQEEPGTTPPAAAAATAEATAAAAEAIASPAAGGAAAGESGAVAPNADTAAAAAASASSPDPAPAPEAATPPPTPPRDFDAAYAENQRRYDEGEIDGNDYQKELRAISKEEGQFTARMEIWADRQQTAEQNALAAFNSAARAWEQANADFMSNPLRAQQMQQAINAVAASKPGLPPAKLFEEAAKIAFEAYGYKPAAVVPAVDVAAATAEAIAKRTPAGVPPTLAGSPAAGPIENSNANPYAALDAMSIDELENAIARMTPAQQEAYLRGAPGANSLATNKPT